MFRSVHQNILWVTDPTSSFNRKEKKMPLRVSDTQLFHLQNRRSCWTKHALRVLMAEEFQKKSPLDGRESIRRVEFESLDSE